MLARSLRLIAALLIITCLSCNSGQPLETTLENHKKLAAALKESEDCLLYEGMPHQMYEANALQKEIAAKKTIIRDSFNFYQQPLAWKGGDEKLVEKLISDSASFSPFQGEKKCGGFHPDYCLEWQTAAGAYSVLLCFGCGEVKVLGPNLAARWDLANDAAEKLQNALKPYRTNRPAPDPNMPGQQ
jgi:hypothetical protein